jgi:hypothetical protein
LHALARHWQQFPPVHITAALLAGIKGAGRPSTPKPIDNVWQAEDVINDADFAQAMIPRQGSGSAVWRLPK